ncbi:L-Proline/Glycine betaine transporter ProP [Apophysomyces sp. BC1034]|nr:L-Proline/Glycine betaine transporter ProP [Apophysomyces sp. BC1015]KAG0188677.1 L-Proline/Glycine betaine transporter ProP [Apophysomyces sp. BC1034]
MNDPRFDPDAAGLTGAAYSGTGAGDDDAARCDAQRNPMRSDTPSHAPTGSPAEPLLDIPLEPPPAPPPAEAAARQWHDLPRPAVQPDPAGALFRPLSGLLAAYAVLMVGNGLFTTLIPIRMLHAGLSTVAVGLVQSCYYAGFIAGAVTNSRLIERIGQHRAFVAFSATAALTALAFGTFDSPRVGGVLRFFSGVAFMGVYACVESWLNGAVPNAMRGRVFSTYLTITYLGVGAGQFLLGAGGASGGRNLLIVGALFVGAILPVTLLEGWPVHVFEDRAGVRRPRSWAGNIADLWRDMPLAIPGCICAGLLSSAFYSMMPVFLTSIGFSVSELSHFMGIALTGALLPQWPVGKLSDRVERRVLVFRIAVLAAVLSTPLIVVRAHWFVSIATFVYVAVAFTLYGLIVSYVNDRIDANRRIAISATLLILFSIGGLSGPTIASVAMTALGPGGLFVFNAATAALLAYAAHRSLNGEQTAFPSVG